jgi:hypothetical protein
MSIKEKVHTIVKTFNNIYGHALELSSFWLGHNLCCPQHFISGLFSTDFYPQKNKGLLPWQRILEENKRKSLKPYVMNGNIHSHIIKLYASSLA